MSAERPALRALAQRLGILDGYRNVDGRERQTSDETREALCAAMGFEAPDEASAVRALERTERSRLVEPVLVWREWAEGRPELIVDLDAAGDDVRDYRIDVRLEDGRLESASGRLPERGAAPTASLPLPVTPPHGYHHVEIALQGREGERRGEQTLIMTPRTVVQPEEVLGNGSAFGIWANLYTVRAQGDWGHGGLRELRRLGRLAGEHGAAFVGINPLHAVTNRGTEFSPYSPASRLYRNPLYLDPEAVPELAGSPEARALLDDPQLRRRRAALEQAASIDHESVLDAMMPLLRELHGAFCRSATPARKDAYAAYREREGTTLRDFATWEVLAAHHTSDRDPAGSTWWRWPAALRHPQSPAVERFRVEHADEVDFRSWLQFELDRQLADTQATLRAAGCELGIYQDLALGSSEASADLWMEPSLFAQGAQVGAPPDAYAPEGQNWGFPPFDPHRLRAEAYRPWSRLLRAAFARSGALRIDHAMGLMRLFWIPQGRPGSEGAYVSYRAQDLLGVLALESRRSGAIAVAEDLGTLPSELPGMLADWGLLRSAVVYFERDDARFRPTAHYPPRALATVSTHDLAPLAGYFEGTDLALRSAAQTASGGPLAAERAERTGERDTLVTALRAEGFLPDEEAEPDARALRNALHAFLAATPSVLVAASLDDLAGEQEPVNLPGVPLTAHRSWSRRMSSRIDDLARSDALREGLAPLQPRSRRPATTG